MAIATLTIDMVAKLASLERDMGRAAHVAEKNAAKMDAAFRKIKLAIAPIAAAFATRDIFLWLDGVGKSAKEIGTLSSASGVGAEQFQRLAYGAKQVGIEQDKLADIFKDTQDKVGEFLQTGGGPLKDFFEQVAPKVGVTVEQFRRLSGPEALQLYFDSLQKANLGQKEMTFYMEAIANDSSRLAPLLRDNGAAWQQMGDEAERFGAVMSQDMIRSSIEFNKQMDKLNAAMTAFSHAAAAEVVPGLTRILEQMTEGIKVAGSFGDALFLFGTMNPFKSVSESVSDLREEVQELEADIARFRSMNAPTESLETALDTTKKRLEMAKLLQRQQALEGAGENYGNEARGQGKLSSVASSPATKPGSGKSGKKSAASKEHVFDELAPSASAYERVMRSLIAAEVEADKSTRDLSKSQEALYDVMRSPEWEKMPEAWRKTVIEQANASAQAERAAELQKRVNEVLAQTPTAELKRSRELMQALADQFHAGALNAEQFSEAAQTALGAIPQKAQEATDAMTVFAEQAARNMQDIFADYLFDGFSNGLDGMLNDFGVMLQRMIAQAVAADLAKRLMGAAGGSDWGSAFASLFGGGKASGGPVHAGTTYLVGERGPELVTMPRDGYVTPNKQLGGTNIINISVSGNQAPGEVRRAAGQGARQALAVLAGARRYA